MKFIKAQIILIAFLLCLVISTNLSRKEESSTLFDMFNNLKTKQRSHTKILQKAKNDFSFKERHRKLKFSDDPPAEEKPAEEKPANPPTPPTETNRTDSTPPAEVNYIIDLNDNSNFLEDWFTVKSEYFHIFPDVETTSKGKKAKVIMKNGQRLNEDFSASKEQGAKTDKFFWFKLKSGYIYYFANKNDMNTLDAILIKTVEDSNIPQEANDKLPTCIFIYDYQKNKFEICVLTMEMKFKFLCSIQNYLHATLDDRCFAKEVVPAPIVEKVIKEVIIIPTASKNCNEGWNYVNRGSDWQCTCKEGNMQSPIDFPLKREAKPTNLTPMFNYERVSVNAEQSTIDGLVEEGKKINIRYEKNALRIFHPNMGRIVALDGAVYVAEEIIFHTPSEHKINGEQFDMEMQIIHYGRTKGDIANQIVLSVLFKTSPGHYNKFLDRIDFFNLPNPMEPSIELQHDFFIPSVFLDTDSEDIVAMEPFSFYNYEGSLTSPPCTERTTYYVTADPVPLSNTVIQLFKEALNRKDMIEKNEDGSIKGVMVETNTSENNRDVQELNGRTVYVFDHILNGCITYQPPKRTIKPVGHYEKITKSAQEYFYVNGIKPTGIPGSFVVSEKEARGQIGKGLQEIPK